LLVGAKKAGLGVVVFVDGNLSGRAVGIWAALGEDFDIYQVMQFLGETKQ